MYFFLQILKNSAKSPSPSKNISIYIYIYFSFISFWVLVLLSALVERFSVSRSRDLTKNILIVFVFMFTFSIRLQDDILPTIKKKSLFSFYPYTQDIDSSSSPPRPGRPSFTGCSRMAEQINDLIVEALDILVASANKSPAELILYKRCSMTFKEVNTPVFSVTDLKGLKYFSVFWFWCLVGICFSGWERVSLHHRIPLYNIIVALSLRPAGSLLKSFMSTNSNIYAQFTIFSRYPGALQPLKN